ncbi:MAG: AAA family ATPase [Bdellovibrionales bacterium]|nr:AAA family ATPase [Bdellovibrionales bacterium]
MFYSRAQITKLFSCEENSLLSTQDLLKGEKKGVLPRARRNDQDERRVRGWGSENLHSIGKSLGYLKAVEDGPLIYSFFVTKGGVLKTALALNLARMAANHGIKTCVVGLDMQCDVTTALGHMEDADTDDLDSALRWMEETRGLYDVFAGRAEVKETVLPTDLPHLFYIPETPELVALEQGLLHRPRREYWLQETVIGPLKKDFDLIVFDCSPNWNQLITNALVASDVLVSPLECKINNFRNFKMFRNFVDQVKKDLRLGFRHIYIPTRLTLSRRLSRDIKDWYLDNVEECLPMAIRDHTQGEEATAMHLSVPEYAPGTPAGCEMNQFLEAIWLPNRLTMDAPESRTKMETIGMGSKSERDVEREVFPS